MVPIMVSFRHPRLSDPVGEAGLRLRPADRRHGELRRRSKDSKASVPGESSGNDPQRHERRRFPAEIPVAKALRDMGVS